MLSEPTVPVVAFDGRHLHDNVSAHGHALHGTHGDEHV